MRRVANQHAAVPGDAGHLDLRDDIGEHEIDASRLPSTRLTSSGKLAHAASKYSRIEDAHEISHPRTVACGRSGTVSYNLSCQ
jgi:hypothetical protein